MAQLFVLLVGLAVLFSVIAFQNGNVPIGVLFALVAASPVAFLVFAAVRGKQGTRQAPGSKGRTLAVRLIAVAVVAAIGYGGYWVLFAPKAADTPARVSELKTGCSSKYFPQNDAYTGTGPHPIGVFVTDDAGYANIASMGTEVPPQWDDIRLNPRQVQVIACLDKPDDGPYLKDCAFTSDSLKLYQGMYDVTLYEAKTGKKIGTEKMRGSEKPSCPSMTLTKRGTTSIHTEPDSAGYRAVLGKYVDN
ncbi:hypothetical protein [Amycolatopsis sp. NPDC058986]|uniref:hypothetical protein n=1 Tax=unclassified Amycolatopsis TaxID=2618356 RepID=UPI0036717D33